MCLQEDQNTFDQTGQIVHRSDIIDKKEKKQTVKNTIRQKNILTIIQLNVQTENIKKN